MSLLRRLWARRRERPALVALSALLLASLVVYPVVDYWLRSTFEFAADFRFGDFGAYRAAVERWERGDAIYRRTDDGGFWGTFLYPPVVLLVFVPFSVVPDFRPAALAWVAATGLVCWVGLQALVAALGYDLRLHERLGLAWLLAGFQPALLAAKLGQTALLVAGLLSFGGAAMVRDAQGSRDPDGESAAGGRRPWALLSGAATAVVAVIKLAYAPIGAHLLHERRRFVGALLVVPPLVWLSVRFFDLAAYRTYVDVLRWGVAQGSDGARSPTLWLAPYYKPLAWVPAAQAVRFAVCLGVAALSVLAPPRARRVVFAMGVAAAPLLTPQTYTYYFVALLPVGVLLVAGELDRDGRPELVLVGLLLVHLHAYGLKLLVDHVPDVVPPFEALRPVYLLLQPGLWGNALLFGLAAVRVLQAVDLPLGLADVREGSNASNGTTANGSDD